MSKRKALKKLNRYDRYFRKIEKINAGQLATRGYELAHNRYSKEYNRQAHRSRISVSHVPNWAPTQLRYNAEGDTKPGFICIHELENGNGICDGNVFELNQAIGSHRCFVPNTKQNRRLYERD